MTVKTKDDSQYRLLKAPRGGKPVFVNMTVAAVIEAFRNQHSNLDLSISTWSSSTPDPSAPRDYDLRSHITALDVETARISALQAAQYIVENFDIPEECMEITYDGGGAGDKDDTGRNAGNAATTDTVDRHSPAAFSPNSGGYRSSGNAKEGATAAVIIISILPVVFGRQPTMSMPAMNYHLARQMADDGISNLDIDVYQRESFVHLPNSINTATGRFIIPVSMKELLYLDGETIAELAKKPKPEDSEASPQRVPEAVEWFAETLADFEKQQCRQDGLQKVMLDNGWEVPPCLRHLMRLRLYDHNRLEAYRVISQFFSWIKAGPPEIQHLIHTVDRRNALQDYQRINAIIAFASENPWFAECEHTLLQQFCPEGGCFMADMIKEYEQPRLFEQV